MQMTVVKCQRASQQQINKQKKLFREERFPFRWSLRFKEAAAAADALSSIHSFFASFMAFDSTTTTMG